MGQLTVDELQWLVGMSLTTVLAIAGIATTAFRSMAARLDRVAERLTRSIAEGDKELAITIKTEDEKLAAAMKTEDDRVHERINRVRDEYVPRRELDDHLKRIDDGLKEIRQDQKSILKLLADRPPP